MTSATLTNPGTIFAPPPSQRPVLVSLTVTTAAVVLTDVRCLCGRLVMRVPGVTDVVIAVLASNDQASGRGRVVACGRCSRKLEVVEG